MSDGLDFRAPALPLTLDALLRRALPAMPDRARAALVSEGAVRARGRDGQPLRSAAVPVAPASRVQVALCDLAELDSAWLAEAAPVWAPPSSAPAAFVRALTPTPPWRSGELALFDSAEGAETAVLGFEVLDTRGGLSELILEGAGADATPVARALATAGFPVVGDRRHGGALLEGGLRLARASESVAAGERAPSRTALRSPPGWWPRESVQLGASPGKSAELPQFRVSRATVRVLARGHPWVLADEECDDPLRYRPGALVRLVSAAGDSPGCAVVDGDGPRVARLWNDAAGSDVERIARALERRAPLLASDDTDAYRLVHGEADGWPGLAIDRFGPLLRAVASGRAARSYAARALALTARALDERAVSAAGAGADRGWVCVEVVQARAPKSARLQCVRVTSGAAEALGLDARGRLAVRERGLHFAIDPGLVDPLRSLPGVGLFPDQRENRARAAAHVKRAGGRWLNLFAHTGAFSTALLAAGAEQVVSVDLSAAYLRWLEANLASNRELGVDVSRHHSVRREGRRYLEELATRERFAGIVLDPPTAAAAGRRFWSVRKDLEPLIALALRRLEVGGWLLVCRNDRGGGTQLEAAVERAAARAAVTLAGAQPAPPGRDFPRLRGFPEGDPFRALWLQRTG